MLLREYGFEARVHRDGAGSGACPDSGVIERSGRSTDLLCDLPGDALWRPESCSHFAGGLLTGCIAAVVAYQLFSHRACVSWQWQDPLSRIENEGLPDLQSLFAIGTGGWFGMGLYQGMPEKIPVVEQDFIFSAIAGGDGRHFAICL